MVFDCDEFNPDIVENCAKALFYSNYQRLFKSTGMQVDWENQSVLVKEEFIRNVLCVLRAYQKEIR